MKKSIVSLVAIATCQISNPARALAQEASPETSAATDDGAGEILVTAERRSQSVQTLPVAISAISGGDLVKNNVLQVNDLQRQTPSLSVQDAGITKFINIRGVGLNGSAPGLATGISYHVDGLFTRELGLSAPYYDLERIEILRGPQGTLAGQNATGGAIFVVSKTPEFDEFSGNASFSYGNFNHVIADGALNLPVSDAVALRVAGYYEKRDSYFTNFQTGSTTPSSFDPGNLKRGAIRGTLELRPASNLRIILRGEHIDQQSDGYALRNLAINSANPWVLNYNTPTQADIQSDRFSGEIKWDVTDGIQIRSLTGYQNYQIDNVYATDGAPATPLPSNQHIRQPIFTQEFNVISTDKSPFQWVLGAYYFTLTSASKAAFAPVPGVPVLIQGSPRNSSKALFAQATYRVSNAFELVAGIRYNKDHNFLPSTVTIGSGAPIPQPDALVDNDAWTGKVGVNFHIDDTNFAYLVASKGYRAGGYNLIGANFGPEAIYNYEVGYKTSLFDRHLRMQFSAFYNRYNNVQLSSTDPASHLTVVQNAGHATIKGVEGQAQAVFGALRLDANVSILDTALGSATVLNGAGVPVQIAGRPLVLAPKSSIVLGAEYEFAIGSELKVTPRIQFSHLGSQWATVLQNPSTDYIKPYNLANASITAEYRNWRLTAFTTNFGDTFYTAGGDGVGNYLGAPREYGFRLGVRF